MVFGWPLWSIPEREHLPKGTHWFAHIHCGRQRHVLTHCACLTPPLPAPAKKVTRCGGISVWALQCGLSPGWGNTVSATIPWFLLGDQEESVKAVVDQQVVVGVESPQPASCCQKLFKNHFPSIPPAGKSITVPLNAWGPGSASLTPFFGSR